MERFGACGVLTLREEIANESFAKIFWRRLTCSVVVPLAGGGKQIDIVEAEHQLCLHKQTHFCFVDGKDIGVGQRGVGVLGVLFYTIESFGFKHIGCR